MKPSFSLQFLKSIFIVPLLALFILTSCQDEIVEVTLPNNQDTISANSNLSNLMSGVSSLNGAIDDIIDTANCFAIVLPVTIQINGMDFIVNTESDYDTIEDMFDAFDDDDDSFEIQFPITIILNDYSEVEITNQTDFEMFVDECLDDAELEDDIECIDFQYPIVFSVYNSNFQVTETVTILNDESLYNFIEDLDGGILVSLNFPVTMILSDGATLQVNNNVELEAAIEAADATCDDDNTNGEDDCNLQTINTNITACIWTVLSYTGNEDLSLFTLEFNSNGSFLITENGNYEDGNWEISETNEGLFITFSNISGDSVIELITGEWQIVDCDDDDLELVRNGETLILDHDCSPGPFACFQGENFQLTECNIFYDSTSSFATFNLYEALENCDLNQVVISFHETYSDAVNDLNPLNGSVYENITYPMTIYFRVESLSTFDFEIFEIELIIENCNPTDCSQADVENYLQECDWVIVSLNGSNDLINYELQFQSDTTLVIIGNGQTLNATYTTTQDETGVYIEFNGVNGANIQAITGSWYLIDCDPERLEMTMGEDTMVMERDCN